jgi:hypothetical protein
LFELKKHDWIRPALQGILIEGLPQAFRCLQSHCKTNFEENKIAFPNSIIKVSLLLINFQRNELFSSDD